MKVGTVIASLYKIEDITREDASGITCLAVNESDGRRVQLKIMSKSSEVDADVQSRFLREMELVTTIAHPNIARALEVGEDEDYYFIAYDLVEGSSLDIVLAERGRFSAPEALSLLIPIASALKNVWDTQKLIHRAVNPENLVLAPDGRLRLTSFGAAKSMDLGAMNLTAAGFTLGSPEYMSPEQCRGEDDLDFHADMYTLGLVLFELVSGRKPFHDKSSMKVMQMQMTSPLPDLSKENLPGLGDLHQILKTMTAKERKERFATWESCIAALNALWRALQGQSPTADPGSVDFQTTIETPGRRASGIGSTLEAGSIVGNGYEIDRKLGAGNFGDVYLAVHSESGELVQIKILPSQLSADPRKVERFQREMRIAASLKHPALLSVLECGEDRGMHYIVTQYEEGVSLEDHIGRYAPFEVATAAALILPVTTLLQHAWSSTQLLHRDIRPRNILYSETHQTAKLMDFGVAKELGTADDNMGLTAMGFTLGTPEYMSPEQISGEEHLDARSDMYALGLVFYELLTGQKAFSDKNAMLLMQKQLTQPPTPAITINPAVSAGAQALLNKVLAKDRAERFATWQEFEQALQDVYDGREPTGVERKYYPGSIAAKPEAQPAAKAQPSTASAAPAHAPQSQSQPKPSQDQNSPSPAKKGCLAFVLCTLGAGGGLLYGIAQIINS